VGEDAAGGAWVIDLDGVVWLSSQPIPGSGRAVQRLRAAGKTILFATNNAAPTVGELLSRLEGAGISARTEDIATSAQAAASLVEKGQSVLVCGDDGILEAMASRHVDIRDRGPVDVVIVGWTRKFDFDRLATAADAVRSGARLIGTNEDATYPTPEGLLPGAGSILAAVSTASQTTPEVAGKPHPPMASLIRRRVGDVSYVVGDRPSTDGSLARMLSARFALVRSGVTRGGREPMTVQPDEEADDLEALVEHLLNGSI
jgi:HAD superfamily hydrolase (TIGR01450 family)